MEDSGPVSIGRVGHIEAVTAWTERRLVFENHPLGEIAEEFNRFNRQKIRIEDEVLRQQEVTGMFQADDPQSFLAFVAEIPGVTVREADSVSTVTVKK
jgi:transmembrane sensor